MDTETPRRSRPSRWLIPLLAVMVLIASATIVILTLIGPTVGNIFSNVSRGLSRGDSGGGSYGGPVVSNPSHPLIVPTAAPISQQRLNPMQAGEIDDNAKWDPYIDYRSRYLSRYSAYSVIDFDVTGRRIIRVVDANGRPIMGAQVEIFVDDVLVSETLTYANGMTLFFPNANEQSRRRDLFHVRVTVDGHQHTQLLDLRKIGDVFDVEMPLVMAQDHYTPVVTLTNTPTPTPTSLPTTQRGQS